MCCMDLTASVVVPDNTIEHGMAQPSHILPEAGQQPDGNGDPIEMMAIGLMHITKYMSPMDRCT